MNTYDDYPNTQTGESFAIVSIGLELAKAFNDLLGVFFSESILDICVMRLRSALRDRDVILHANKDGFSVLLCPLRSPAEARAVASRLIDVLQSPLRVEGHTTHFTACAGIVLAPQYGTDIDILLRRAGIAMRAARHAKTDPIYLYENTMEARMLAVHSLLGDLHHAMSLHQLEVHYQPQITLKDHRLVGFEALLRWKHPRMGWVSPAEFIPLAEESGMINAIGSWVLDVACRQSTELPHDLVIAVNASPMQLTGGSLLESVTRALAKASLPPTRLAIEITEGVVLSDSKIVKTTLRTLNSMGVKLAMDDFGTGYSSLGQLAKFPFDTIKIDRSLVGRDVKQRAIVRAIAMLGRELGISTLAEGIETEEALANANLDGCTSAQGYLFGKAVPADRVQDVVTAFSTKTTQGFFGALGKAG